MNVVRITRWAWLLGFEFGVRLGSEATAEAATRSLLQELLEAAGTEDREALDRVLRRTAARRLEAVARRLRGGRAP